MLKLHNTLTRKKEEFTPLNASNIRMYVCGITPYDDPHLGNARPLVVFDVLFRLLKQLYPQVTYVRNFTDVDDKIIARASELGEQPDQLAQRFIDVYHANAKALGCISPTHEPRVSDAKVMQGIISFVDGLMKKGGAYQISDGIYLDISRIDSLKDKTESYHYGQLSGKKIDELVAGARVDVNPEKRNSGDFALWKFAKPGEPSWTSPWGNGRPGWHIECSVMSEQLLGARFDLHGGGEDLQFPHHENELAQSVACHGHIHANIWLHNAFITVEGKKMSKSLGNFTTINDALTQHAPLAIRYWLLQTHYRKPVDYSSSAVEAATKPLKRIQAASHEAGELSPDFISALCDDLNTSKAMAAINKALAENKPVGAMAAILGLA